MSEKEMLVTTDADMWNSADESHFFVVKGQVKALPEETTPIIEDALSQGLLREATSEEIKTQKFSNLIDKAIEEKRIKTGKTYEDTVKNYQTYMKSIEEMRKEVKEEEKEVKIETKTVAEKNPVTKEVKEEKKK